MDNLLTRARRGEKITLTDKIATLASVAEWDGFVQELRFHKRQLTDAERAALNVRRCELGGARHA